MPTKPRDTEVPAAGTDGTFDLLALINPELDTLAGHFKRNGDGSLQGYWNNCARIEIPYVLPEQYEMSLEVTVGHGERELGDFWLVLPVRGGTDSAVLGFLTNRAERYSCIGIHNVDGKNYSQPGNPTCRRLPNTLLFPEGERRVLTIVALRNRVEVLVDGRAAHRLDVGLGSRTWGKVDPPNRLVNPAHFGIGGHFTDLMIHRFDVKPRGAKAGKVGTRPTEDRNLARVKRTGVRFGGHVYQQFPIDVSLKKARELCAAMGGALVAVDSPAEHRFLSELVRTSKVPAWINLERKGGDWLGPDAKVPPYLPFDPAMHQAEHVTIAHVAADGQITSVDPAYHAASIVCEWSAGGNASKSEVFDEH